MLLLYIDPGTGSLLFSVLIGLSTAFYFLFRKFIIKLKIFFSPNTNKLLKYYNYVIYNEGDQYWPVFEPILEEFENRRIDVSYLTSSLNDEAFKNNYSFIHPEYIGVGNKVFSILNMLETDICLMTTPGLDVYQLKRSKLCKHYSHILHDTGDATCYKLFGLDWFDSVLLSGEYQINDIRELENIRKTDNKNLFVVGSTYLDYYSKKINFLKITKNHVFTVLVSPSWGQGSLLNLIGERLLENLSNTGWCIIVRPHPQSKKSEPDLLKKLEEKFSYFTWDYNSENLDSLSKADIMISDFSGIIFDYIFLFNKPVLYNNSKFFKQMYDAGDIDHELWKFEIIRKIAIELSLDDIDNITETIKNVISITCFAEERRKAKETAWQNFGQSGITVVNTLVNIRNSFYN